MSYIERINKVLLRLKDSEAALQKKRDDDLHAVNTAYESAKQDDYYYKYRKIFTDLYSTISAIVEETKKQISSLPDSYSIVTDAAEVDVRKAVSERGFVAYSKDLISRCRSAIGLLTEQSSVEDDIGTVRLLTQYLRELNTVCAEFDKFYRAEVRTNKMIETSKEIYEDDIRQINKDFDNSSSQAIQEAVDEISKYKPAYRQTADRLSNERFSAPTGGQKQPFPTSICLGSITHPVVDYRRDLVSKTLGCCSASELPVVFEMPLTGGFIDYGTYNGKNDQGIKNDREIKNNQGVNYVLR